MSDEMAVGDNANIEESKVNGDEAAAGSSAGLEVSISESPSDLVPDQPKEETVLAESALESSSISEDQPVPEVAPSTSTENQPIADTEPDTVKQEVNPVSIEENEGSVDDQRGIKRRASAAFSDNTDEEFKGFGDVDNANLSVEYGKVLERLEAEVTAASTGFTPVRTVMATPTAPPRASKRQRQDTGKSTDGSRPSSALSSRSEGEFADIQSPASHRNRRATTEMSSPLLRIPLEKGWKRELVYRAINDSATKRNADIYYYTPLGKKLRSSREVSEYLAGTGLTLENFSFFKEPLGVDDPEKEIIRDAKLLSRRLESPVQSPAPVVLEGKRTPKPKAPKGASPEPAIKSPPAKIKVKSLGSRLSASTPSSTPKQKKPAPNTENNNTAAVKKPSEEKRRGRMNGAAPAPLPVASPRRRARARNDDTDHFTGFYKVAQDNSYNVVVQIFQYLGMRDLAHCARVCKLWRELAATPALWKYVRMKNSHVSDWGGLTSALKRRGTKRLDLRKMLLPQDDTVFWEQFSQHIASVDTLETIEMCRCPASAVTSLCRGLAGLRGLSALAIRDAALDPAPLAALTQLHELRLKSMTGLSLTRDLMPLAALKELRHLSLTSIKELGWCACDVVGQLTQLVSLELGECSFDASFGTALRRLVRLRRLRLERGTAQCAAPDLLRALASLPDLASLELVNVDVKVGFDDALAECKNIQRLLIIPTYVSQSATTNKQVLSGVLRLKDTLTHLMWGVTIELLRVTELFIDQCEQAGARRKDVGECIPVLKPVPGCRLPLEHRHVATPPQVEILPLPTLQRLLSAQLPNTKLKLLRIPFHATWRQSLADFQ